MKTIIETAADAGQFSTLLAGLAAAQLTDTLKGAGPFTVFAPSDDAFKKLPAGALESMLKDAKLLKSVLTYHVVAGTHRAEDLKTGDVKSLEGAQLAVSVTDAGVKVDGARVEKADIAASNGVIHAIDTVLTPSGTTLKAAA
ncbi:MAG: fasciclin domain-containing protein [Pseudomonadales bacterium]|jgi:uncharacterized surface protein with fasciclin (FAS1) repeats|nr:fasciclin domain-containing protein [Pseudomonadales bacterium]